MNTAECAIELELHAPDPGMAEYLCFLNVPVFMACLGSLALVLLVGTRVATNDARRKTKFVFLRASFVAWRRGVLRYASTGN